MFLVCYNKTILVMVDKKGGIMKKHFSYKLLLVITLIIFGCKRNRPPQIPIISAPSTGNTNVPVDFMISTTDPDKDEVAYQLSCGDGTRDTTWTAYFPSGQSVPITHNYSKPGNYSAMAKAKDTKEKESDWSNPHQISISSQAPNTPSLPSGPTNGRINVAYDFSTSTTDPDGDSVAYQFDWGDNSDTTWTQHYPGGQTISQSHTFTSIGTFNIKVKAKDKDNIESGWSSPLVITIAVNQAPNTPSTPNGPSSGYTNIPYTFSSSATDPDGENIAIRFDWGNGVVSNWSNYVTSGTTISMSYSYPNAGTYYIKAQAKDILGDTSAWSTPHTITINTPSGWITMISEDFEGEFPGTTWTLYGTPTWDDENYRSYQGSWSGWCAGSTISPPGPYAPDMNAWMVYGPFSLVDASDASLSFYRWVETEDGYDSLFFGASINGTDFYGNFISGVRRYWYDDSFDLTDVPALGNLCGRSQVWIGFGFISDGSFQYEGVYLDNILLEKYVDTKASGKPRVSLKDITPNLNRHIIPGKMTIPHSDRKK